MEAKDKIISESKEEIHNYQQKINKFANSYKNISKQVGILSKEYNNDKVNLNEKIRILESNNSKKLNEKDTQIKEL